MNIDFNEYSLGGTVGGYSSGSGLRRKPTNPVLDKSHPLNRGLVASYTLNRPGSAFVFDYSGNARHGVGSSANWAFDAKEGMVWQFPAGTQQPVTFDDNNRICGNAITTTFSVRCRYKCAAIPAASSGLFGDSAAEFAASLAADGTSSLKVYTGTGNRYLGTYPKVTADDKWHDVVWTCNLTTGYVRSYVDGVQVGITSITAGGSVRDVAQALDESYAANSDIQVSALEYWDRVLSADEVRELAKIGQARHAQEPVLLPAIATAGSYTPDLTSDGWATIPSVTSGIEIYVDATGGSDSNDGLSSGAPKQTLSAALSLITSGQGDHIFLKRGEQWAESISVGWSGASADDPIVVTSYGNSSDPAPKITEIRHQGGTARNYVWFIDLYLSAGASMLSGGDGWRLEGLLLTNNDGLSTEGALVIQCIDNAYTNLAIHRCVICDSHKDASSGHQQGMFCSGLSNGFENMVVTECIFEHNGHDGWDGAIDPGHEATIYNHNVYVQYDSGDSVEFRKCWFGHGSSHGLQLRCGGVVEDCFFTGNPISLLIGNSYGLTERVQGVVRRNVIVDGGDIGASGRGWALDVQATNACDVTYNIACNNTSGSYPSSFTVASNGLNATGATFKRNVTYKWGSPWLVMDTVSGVALDSNDIQEPDGGDVVRSYPSGISSSADNRYYTVDADGSRFQYNGSDVTDASWKASVGDSGSSLADLSGVYTAPNRTLVDYATSVGMADETELLTALRTQRKGHWDLNLTPDRINAYFRANFDMRPAPSSLTATKDNEDVVLTWDEIPEAESYIVRRRTDGGAWEVIG